MSKLYETICDSPMARSGLGRGKQVAVNVTPQGFTGGYIAEGTYKGKRRRIVNTTNRTPGVLYRVRVTAKV